MGNPVDLEALDSRLWNLLGLLEQGKLIPNLAAAIRQFVQDYTSDKWGPRSLFRSDWEEMWGRPWLFPNEQAEPLSNAWILAADGLDDRQMHSLTDVGVAAVRFLKDSDSSFLEKEHAQQLTKVLRYYLDARKYDVSAPNSGTGPSGRLRPREVDNTSKTSPPKWKKVLRDQYPLVGLLKRVGLKPPRRPRDAQWLPLGWESAYYPRGSRNSDNIDAILEWLGFQMKWLAWYAEEWRNFLEESPDEAYMCKVDETPRILDAHSLAGYLYEVKQWKAAPPEPSRSFTRRPEDLEAAAEEMEKVRQWIEHKADTAQGEDVEDVPPLTESQQQAYDLIKTSGPLQGNQIVNRLGIGSESTFTRHYVPALKAHGIKNRRGLGYYHPEHYDRD